MASQSSPCSRASIVAFRVNDEAGLAGDDRLPLAHAAPLIGGASLLLWATIAAAVQLMIG